MLIDLPYDITAVKYVHWTWHDTDPNIYDRHYWVPWNSYYFHATFAASLTFWFHCWRRIIIGKSEDKWEAGEYVIFHNSSRSIRQSDSIFSNNMPFKNNSNINDSFIGLRNIEMD